MDDRKFTGLFSELTVTPEQNEQIYASLLGRKARYIRSQRRNRGIASVLLIALIVTGLSNMQAIADALSGLFSFVWGVGVMDSGALSRYTVLQEPIEINDPNQGKFILDAAYSDEEKLYLILDIRETEFVKDVRTLREYRDFFGQFALVIDGETLAPVYSDCDYIDDYMIGDQYEFFADDMYSLSWDLKANDESVDESAYDSLTFDVSDTHSLYLAFEYPRPVSDFQLAIGKNVFSASLSPPLQYMPVARQTFGDVELSIISLGGNRFAYTGRKIGAQEAVPLYYHSALFSGIRLIDEDGNEYATQQKFPRESIYPEKDIIFSAPSIIEPLEKIDRPIVGIRFSSLSIVYTLTAPEDRQLKPEFQKGFSSGPILGRIELKEQPAISVPITLPARGKNVRIDKEIPIGDGILIIDSIKQYDEHYKGEGGNSDYYGYKVSYSTDTDLLIRPVIGLDEMLNGSGYILGGDVHFLTEFRDGKKYYTEWSTDKDLEIFDETHESTLYINAAGRVFRDGEILFLAK